MTSPDHELIELLKRMRYDLTDLQMKVTNALNMVAALNLPDPVSVICPRPNCGVRLRSERKLAEHVFQLHDGPEPEHWLTAEALASEPAEPIEEEA